MDENDARLNDFRDKGNFSSDDFKCEEELPPVEEEPAANDLLLGQLAIKKNIIRSEQLAECLVHQKQNGGRLGEILIAKGFISEAQLADILLEQRQHVKDRLEEEHKTPMICRKCGAAFHVQGFEFGKVYRCPDCKGVLIRQADPQTIMGYKTRRLSETDTSVPDEIKAALSGENEFFGKYLLLKRVGSGGGGTVYRAFDVELERIVALKVFTSSGGIDLERTRIEAQLAAKLEHNGIPRVYEAGAVEGLHFISMQFVEGKPIGVTETPLMETLRIVRDTANILHYAHTQGIIHRDIKPSNIMIDGQGRIWLMDFGIAKMTQADAGKALTQTGDIMGTPQFMSPEQAKALHKELDARTDVFSLGSTMYFLLTGTYPFTGPNFMEVLHTVQIVDPAPVSTFAPGIPKDVEAIVTKAMEKEKERRYRTAKEFADDIDRFLNGEPVTAKPVGFFGRMVRKARRNRKTVTIAAGISIVLLSVAALGIWQLIERRKAEDKSRRLIEIFLNGIKDKYDEALERRKSGDGYEALQRLAERAENEYQTLHEQLRESNVRDADVDSSLGKLYRLVGNNRKAVQFHNAALQTKPDHADSNYELGMIEFEELSSRLESARERWIREQSGKFSSRAKTAAPEPGWSEPTQAELIEFAKNRDKTEHDRIASLRASCCSRLKPLQTGAVVIAYLDGRHYYALKLVHPSDTDGIMLQSKILMQTKPDPDYTRAIAILTPAISNDRGNVRLLLERARVYESLAQWKWSSGQDALSEFESAITDLSTVTKLHPANADARLKLGRTHTGLGLFRKSRGIDPLADFDSAAKQLQNGEGVPSYDLHLWRGLICLQRGIYLCEIGKDCAGVFGEAVDHFHRATQASPEKFDAWASLAIVNSEIGLAAQLQGKSPDADYEKALQFCEKALAVNANSYDTWLVRARVYGNLALLKPEGNYDSAIKAVDAAILAAEKGGASGGARINPFHAWSVRGKLLTNRALHRQSSGDNPVPDYEDGAKSFESSINLNPSNADAFSGRGALYLNYGNFERNEGRSSAELYAKARRDFEKTTELNPNAFEGWLRLGALLAQTGSEKIEELQKAVSCLDKALVLNSKSAEAFLRRGRLFATIASCKRKIGENPLPDYESAEKSYRESIAIDASNILAWQFLAEQFLARGSYLEEQQDGMNSGKAFDNAADAYEKCAGLDPKTANAMKFLSDSARERAKKAREH